MVHRDLKRKLTNPYLHQHTSFNHPPQVIKQLPTSISVRLSNNSSRKEIFNTSKCEYETALKNSGYQQTKLIFSKREQRKQKRICKRDKKQEYCQVQLLLHRKFIEHY